MSSDKQKLVNGMFWTAIGKYSPMVVSIAVSMVLARLLVPEQFGTVALSSVIISFLTMLSTMGIAPAVIQRKDLTEDDLDNIFTFSCILGFVFAAVLFCISWPISHFYKNEQLIIVCQILSVSLFFNAINMVPSALMSKNLRFKENAKRNLILQCIVGPIAVLAAFLGAGIYSLLISPVVTAIGIFIYNHHFYPVKIVRRFKLSSIKKILSYSTYQFLFQLVNFFTGNIDKLALGKFLGSSDLGYYQQANQLIQMPASNITSVVYPVMHPIFSVYQDDKRLLYSKYSKIITLVAAITFPIAVLMYFSGPEIIHIFYGGKWDLAIPPFKVMSLILPILVILPVTGTFFQSSNSIKYLFNIGLINSLVTIATVFFVGLTFHSIIAFAWAMVFTHVSNLLVTYYFMFRKVLKDSLFDAIKLFFVPIVVSVIIGILLFAENILLKDYVVLNLCVKIITTLLVMYIYIQKSDMVDVRNIVKEFFGKITKRNTHTCKKI